MINELLNAMMLAELLFDKSVVTIGSRSLAVHHDGLMAPMRILHVDDEPDIREVVELALGLDPNLVMKSCGSGREALAVAAEWKPDLILLDIVMPDMGGAATLGRLRIDVRTSTPVVFMTASPKAREPEYYRSLGAAGVIFKPFELTTLAASVRDYLPH
jgi:CheY-like chemotaxis protein